MTDRYFSSSWRYNDMNDDDFDITGVYEMAWEVSNAPSNRLDRREHTGRNAEALLLQALK